MLTAPNSKERGQHPAKFYVKNSYFSKFDPSYKIKWTSSAFPTFYFI